MKTSTSRKTLESFSAVVKRKAEENWAQAKEVFKAKAHSFSFQVQETVATKRTTSRRRSSGGEKRATSAAPELGLTVDQKLVSEICSILDPRVSQVAARLALSKCRGIDKKDHLQVACDWLLDENNSDEIEAAEICEIEKTGAAATQKLDAKSGEAISSSSLCGDDSTGRSPVRVGRPRAVSMDDGRGLGFFMGRKSKGSPRRPSEPSPRKVPMPRRLSRGVSGRVSNGSANSGVEDSRRSLVRMSIGSQTSTGSESHCLDMTPRGHGDREEAAEPFIEQACETGQHKREDTTQSVELEYKELESEEDDEEEHEEEEEAFPAPLPPDSACWDWPLSRQEKKARVRMLEHHINVVDKQSLKQENDVLRSKVRKMSTGGESHSKRSSRMST
jgi:hypothetical protein